MEYEYFGKNVPLTAFLGEKRYQLFENIKKNLELCYGEKYTILSGDNMGKTFFLKILKKYLKDILVYIDVGIMNLNTCSNFFEYILESICKDLKLDKKDYKLKENFDYEDFYGRFIHLINIGRRQYNKSIILLFDQISFLYKAKLPDELFRHLYNFVVNGEFSGIFTGFGTVHQFFTKEKASAWNDTKSYDLYGLSKNDCKTLLLNLELDSNKTDELYEDSGGHPYIINKYLFSYINQSQLSDVKDKLKNNLFIRWFNKLNKEEKYIYKELFSKPQSLQSIKFLFQDKDTIDINICCKNLRNMNLIMTSDERNYFTTGNLFKEWYKENIYNENFTNNDLEKKSDKSDLKKEKDKYYKSFNGETSEITRQEAEEITKSSEYTLIIDRAFKKCIYYNGEEREIKGELTFNTLSYLAFYFGRSKSLDDIALNVWDEALLNEYDCCKIRNCIGKINDISKDLIKKCTLPYYYTFNENINVCILHTDKNINFLRQPKKIKSNTQFCQKLQKFEYKKERV